MRFNFYLAVMAVSVNSDVLFITRRFLFFIELETEVVHTQQI